MEFGRTSARRSMEPRVVRLVADGGKPLDIVSTSISVGFWEWTASVDSFWISRHARGVLGLGPATRVTRKALLAAIHAEDRGRVLRAIGALGRDSDSVELQLRLAGCGREMRWIDAQARTHRDSQGALRKITGWVVDITERKRADAELLALRQQAIHLTRVSVVGEFSAALVHELQQPLTSIRCNALAAQRLIDANSEHPQELRAVLEDILASEARAEQLIERMRSLLKRRQTQFKRVEIGKLIQSVLALAAGTFGEREVELCVRIEEHLPALRGDLVELEQVLLNLLLNACQTMTVNAPADRRVELIAVLDARAPAVRFSVIDSGTGIDSGHFERVFDPFFSTKETGLGLGLAICRAIVEAHHGRIWAENNPVRGAAFHFTVPVMGEA